MNVRIWMRKRVCVVCMCVHDMYTAHVCMCVCACGRLINVCTGVYCIYVQVCERVYRHVCVHMCVHALCTCVCMLMYTCVHV